MHGQSGLFIVLEGLDGAGTTTQAARLLEYSTRANRNSFATFEPTDKPIGRMIRDAISHHLTDLTHELGQRELGLLFAADRLNHSRWIEETRAAGGTVICDRYVFSSMAYQSLDKSAPGEWVVEINAGCAVPDVTIFLDVPVDECMRRISARNETTTVFEKRDFLQTIADNYTRLQPLYKQHFGRLEIVDGTLTPNEVHEAIVSLLSL